MQKDKISSHVILVYYHIDMIYIVSNTCLLLCLVYSKILLIINADQKHKCWLDVRPRLTRVRVVMARACRGLCAGAYLVTQTTFRIRLPMIAHGRKSSSFTFSSYCFLLGVLFPTAR